MIAAKCVEKTRNKAKYAGNGDDCEYASVCDCKLCVFSCFLSDQLAPIYSTVFTTASNKYFPRFQENMPFS